MRTIFHIDFNSYFATVEQQANPRLRGKPIGVTGGDRMSRTVIGAASVEAKKFGVKTGMSIPEALKFCPQIILVKGDSDKYLACTKRFLNILKDYSPFLEVFSIDECFLEMPVCHSGILPKNIPFTEVQGDKGDLQGDSFRKFIGVAEEIKQRIREEVGEWISCSVGISYNKLMAKLAGSLYKPDGLVVVEDPEAAMRVLDRVELDDVCGIGFRIKARLNNMGVRNFAQLRQVPLESLLASFKSYGQILYNMARGIDDSEITPFYEKEEVKSVGHRHTINHDTNDPEEIKQILLKLTELIARRLREKRLLGRTVVCFYRAAFDKNFFEATGHRFNGDGMQTTIELTQDGLDIFKAAWKVFEKIWDLEPIRMVGVSVSNLTPERPRTLSFLPEIKRREVITSALDKINNKYGEFTLQRGVLLNSVRVYRKPNPFLSDRRFKL